VRPGETSGRMGFRVLKPPSEGAASAAITSGIDLAAAARQLAKKSRVRQGLPRKIEDAATLHRVAMLVLGADTAVDDSCDPPSHRGRESFTRAVS
jgi:hypothetical protein